MGYRPRIVFDFDGVIHRNRVKYTVETEVNDGPVPGALGAVNAFIADGFEVVVMSSRAMVLEGQIAIMRWLQQNGFPRLRVTHEKVGAALYIDDCGYHFDPAEGFPTPAFVRSFRSWNKR